MPNSVAMECIAVMPVIAYACQERIPEKVVEILASTRLLSRPCRCNFPHIAGILEAVPICSRASQLKVALICFMKLRLLRGRYKMYCLQGPSRAAETSCEELVPVAACADCGEHCHIKLV